MIRMQEAKQTFPGNTTSDGLFKLSAFTFAFLFFVSATEGRFQSGTEFFGIDGTYFHLVGLAMVATLSYQHKAVFTKKAGEGKVHFWKQFTPYFVYARREIDVKDLSYWIKKTTSTDTETGRSDSSFRTYVYEGNKKIFVYSDKTDYFREILGKGPRRKNDEMDLGMKIFLPILFVVGVGFLVVGLGELYSALTGSDSDGDLFFSWGLPSLYTLIGAFFIIIPGAIAWSEFAKRRFLAADPVTPDTPLHDVEEWWDPKSRLKREEVDLVIKNASAGEIRASILVLGAFAMVALPVLLGVVFILAATTLGLSALFLLVNGPIAFQTAVLSLFFFTSLLGVFLFAFYQGFKTLLTTEVKWVLASRRGAMEIHYVSWRGLVDIVHLEATEITAIHQTIHPSWAGPPTDAYIIAGWKIFRAPLHDDASRLCEVLGIELDRTAPNLADLYVKQGDMSGNRPREVSGDAEFEGYRDTQKPFGMWFLSAFVWAFVFFLSLFMEASGFDEGPLLVTVLGLWVTWTMFSWAFSRPVLSVLNTQGRLVVDVQFLVRRRRTEEWPIAEASHIVAKGKSRPDQTNMEWFTLVGVNSEGGKWGPAWEYDLGYLLPRSNAGDVVEEASMAMGIAGGIADAIGIPIVTRPYEKMKVQQLKEEARGRGLEVGGRKADLVSRLYESDAMARQG
tara:strand:- start:1274 stop:3301 length:2028 start_codon:yes stop_codon:yes gene_type:complete